MHQVETWCIYFVFLGFVEVISAREILQVCHAWKNKRQGICIPEEECFGDKFPFLGTCGRQVCCFNPVIARLKCLQYRREAAKNKSIMKKIAGGTETGKHEFPFIVAVGFEMNPGTFHWNCGGSIISPEFVLTAAHCCHSLSACTHIKAGTNDLQDPHGTVRKVQEFIKQDSYVNWAFKYDIGLLRLEKELSLSDKIMPACLLYENEQYIYTKRIAAGWGKTTDSSKDELVNKLKKVELNSIDLYDCMEFFPTQSTHDFLHPGTMCAGNLKGGDDVCKGDSGGPLLMKMENASFDYGLIGVVSGGSTFCGGPNSPGIFARTSYYLSWIARIVWPDETTFLFYN